jgi:hypothetical protein
MKQRREISVPGVRRTEVPDSGPVVTHLIRRSSLRVCRIGDSQTLTQVPPKVAEGDAASEQN